MNGKDNEYITYLEERLNYLSDRVGSLEAALAVLMIGINRGSLPVNSQRKIHDIMTESPHSREMLAKFKEIYERA